MQVYPINSGWKYSGTKASVEMCEHEWTWFRMVWAYQHQILSCIRWIHMAVERELSPVPSTSVPATPPEGKGPDARWRNPLLGKKIIWLVVWTPLKNISQLGWLFPIYGKIKNGNQTTNQSWMKIPKDLQTTISCGSLRSPGILGEGRGCGNRLFSYSYAMKLCFSSCSIRNIMDTQATVQKSFYRTSRLSTKEFSSNHY